MFHCEVRSEGTTGLEEVVTIELDIIRRENERIPTEKRKVGTDALKAIRWCDRETYRRAQS